jgi:hypothetical protein
MADPSTLDKIKDLAHHAYDAVTGTISDAASKIASSAPREPIPSDVGSGAAANAAKLIANRDASTMAAVDAMSK